MAASEYRELVPEPRPLTALVAQAQQGDRTAFERIVALWRRRIIGFVGRMLGRPDDAEDVAQDVFVRVYLSLNKLRDPAQFEPWLYRLAANAAIDYLRRNRRTRVRLSDLSDEQLFTIEKTQALTASALSEREREGRDQATRLLDLLNGPARSLLILKEVEGLSLRELAAVFGISEDAVKVRLFRARQRILKEMSRSEAPQREGVTSAPFSAPLTVTT